ncbi:MAG TPA: hypothetical protein VFQ59_02685 [Candidatus Paceibacterota bacterium]|nr:hypothetical protein [Candidatus Paceibacterota bacterium]
MALINSFQINKLTPRRERSKMIKFLAEQFALFIFTVFLSLEIMMYIYNLDALSAGLKSFIGIVMMIINYFILAILIIILAKFGIYDKFKE